MNWFTFWKQSLKVRKSTLESWGELILKKNWDQNRGSTKYFKLGRGWLVGKSINYSIIYGPIMPEPNSEKYFFKLGTSRFSKNTLRIVFKTFKTIDIGDKFWVNENISYRKIISCIKKFYINNSITKTQKRVFWKYLIFLFEQKFEHNFSNLKENTVVSSEHK